MAKYNLQHEEPLTIREMQQSEDEAKKDNKGLRQHLIAEATKELLQYIVETPGLSQPIYDKALNLLNALNK